MQRFKLVGFDTDVDFEVGDVSRMTLQDLREIAMALAKGRITASDAELTQLRNRAEELGREAEIAQLEQEIAGLESELRQMEIDELEQEIAALERELAEVEPTESGKGPRLPLAEQERPAKDEPPPAQGSDLATSKTTTSRPQPSGEQVPEPIPVPVVPSGGGLQPGSTPPPRSSGLRMPTADFVPRSSVPSAAVVPKSSGLRAAASSFVPQQRGVAPSVSAPRLPDTSQPSHGSPSPMQQNLYLGFAPTPPQHNPYQGYGMPMHHNPYQGYGMPMHYNPYQGYGMPMHHNPYHVSAPPPLQNPYVGYGIPSAMGVTPITGGRTATLTRPKITETNFVDEHKSGNVTVTPVKWWSSKTYPGHNIELMINLQGIPWAIVHIKWKDRTGPKESNVLMMTFKNPDNTSMYGGNINSGPASRLLLAEALRYADVAPQQSGDVPITPK